MVPLDSVGVETSRVSQLVVHITSAKVSTMTGRVWHLGLHDKPAISAPLLQHEVEREFASELDQSVVPGFCDNQDRLDVGAHSSPACDAYKISSMSQNQETLLTELLAHLPDTDSRLRKLPGQTASIVMFLLLNSKRRNVWRGIGMLNTEQMAVRVCCGVNIILRHIRICQVDITVLAII